MLHVHLHINRATLMNLPMVDAALTLTERESGKLAVETALSTAALTLTGRERENLQLKQHSQLRRGERLH